MSTSPGCGAGRPRSASVASASSLRRACEVMSTRPAMVMRKSAAPALAQLERTFGRLDARDRLPGARHA